MACLKIDLFYFLFFIYMFVLFLHRTNRIAPLGWTETGVDRFLPLYMWGAVRHEETAPYRCGAKIPPITGRTEPCTALIWTYMFYVFIEIIRMCNITFVLYVGWCCGGDADLIWESWDFRIFPKLDITCEPKIWVF